MEDAESIPNVQITGGLPDRSAPTPTGITMEQSELQAMADKLDRLIERCRKLEQDNSALRELQDEWNRERAQLIQRNDLAKNRIEAMIGRLRALEQH